MLMNMASPVCCLILNTNIQSKSKAVQKQCSTPRNKSYDPDCEYPGMYPTTLFTNVTVLDVTVLAISAALLWYFE